MANCSRRSFIAMAAALAAAPNIFAGRSPIPSDLDHILLGANDLEQGIAWLEQRSGVRAIMGGVHPGRGTRNALLALGPRQYLEIIAPDPQQSDVKEGIVEQLRTLTGPKVVNWAVHTGDIAAVVQKAATAGIATDGPRDGSRARPDGKTLHWKSLGLKDDKGGVLPFFIEWSNDSVHPSEDAPRGCQLLSFEIESNERRAVQKVCAGLGVDVMITQKKSSALKAKLRGLRDEFTLD